MGKDALFLIAKIFRRIIVRINKKSLRLPVVILLAILIGLVIFSWHYYQSLFPDHSLTPGAVFAEVTEAQVCVVGYTKTVRSVPMSVKKKVFELYGIPWEDHSGYEVDHYISLELGGSNDITNLWPEPYNPRPGARQKDVVENYLHRQVCKGEMSLREAQEAIVGDWYVIFKQVQENRKKR